MRKNNNKIAIIDGTLSKDKVFIKKKKKIVNARFHPGATTGNIVNLLNQFLGKILMPSSCMLEATIQLIRRIP